MPLTSILELFTNKFQVACDIKQVLCIRMEFMEDAFFTDSQLQVYKQIKK